MVNRQDRFSGKENQEQVSDSLFRKLNVTKTKTDDVSQELEESDMLRFDWNGLEQRFTVPITNADAMLGSGICPLWIREACTVDKVMLMHSGSGSAQHGTSDYFTFTAWSAQRHKAFTSSALTHHKQLLPSGAYELPKPYTGDSKLEQDDTLFLRIDVVGSPTNPLSEGTYQLEIIARRRRSE